MLPLMRMFCQGSVYDAEELVLRRPAALEVAHLQRAETRQRRRQEFRQLLDEIAVVEHLLPERHAAVRRDAGGQPRRARDVEPVPVLVLVTIVRRERGEVAQCVAERAALQHGVDVVVGQRLARQRQPWIGRHREVVRRVVSGRRRGVVGDEETAVDPTIVRDAGRQSRRELLLNARRELPVPRPVIPAAQRGRILHKHGNRAAEVRRQIRTALAVAQRCRDLCEIAVGDVVVVCVGHVDGRVA